MVGFFEVFCRTRVGESFCVFSCCEEGLGTGEIIGERGVGESRGCSGGVEGLGTGEMTGERGVGGSSATSGGSTMGNCT